MASNQPVHFELPDWIDYIRRVGSPDRLAAMELHLLGERCARCSELFESLSAAYGAARQLHSFEPPGPAVGKAYTIFQPSALSDWRNLPSVIARLIPPQTPMPALAAGWRTGEAQDLQVFEAGALQLHLIQCADPSGDLTIVGTVKQTSGDAGLAAGCRIYAVSGRSTLAQTITNDFGEFCLEVPPARNLRLVAVPQGAADRFEIELGTGK